MNTLDRLRPEPQPLDAEWSAATLRDIFASGEPAVTRTRTTVPRRAVGSVIAATAAVIALMVGSTTMGSSAAFAVEQDGHGDVVVTIHRFTDAAGLEKALRDHGIDAQVTYLRARVPSDLDDGSVPSPCVAGQTVGQTVGATVDPSGDGGFAVTFERAYLAAHRGAELALTAAGGNGADDWAGVRIGWSDGRC